MAEHDNAGFPLAYCMLSTAESVEQGKRIAAIEAWSKCLRDQYGLDPKFIHTDKDMGEIAAARHTWRNAKISLCLWHLNRAVKARLSSAKLPTTPYDPARAHSEFPFIDESFYPPGHSDPKEYEGGDHGELSADTLVDTTNSPSKRRAKKKAKTVVSKENNTVPKPPKPVTTLGVGGDLAGLGAGKIRIPASQLAAPRTRQRATQATADRVDLTTREVEVEDDEASKRTFCLLHHRQTILDMLESHYNAHPLIPGVHSPSASGVKQWAVLQMYEFCVKHDLREVWAYLWGNWYRKGRWELWARSTCAEIPILRTTMMLESQ